MNSLSPLQQKELTEVLSSFGFNKKDERVYLALLAQGQTTLTPLSRALGIPVSTIQSTIKRLVDKGVVNVSKRKSRSIYEASSPTVFKELLKEQARGISNILPILESLKTETSQKTRIQVFERERVTDILNASLQAKSKEVFEIVSAKPFQEVIGEKFHYTRRRIHHHVRLKSLRVRSQEIKIYNKQSHERELREARFLPAELTFSSSVLFWDKTVAFFSTASEGLHWMIESPSLHMHYQQLFDLLWTISGTMNTADNQKPSI